jgi:hypothetical protein
MYWLLVAFSSGVKAGVAWSWPSLSSAYVTNTCSRTSTPPYTFVSWCWNKHGTTLFCIWTSWTVWSHTAVASLRKHVTAFEVNQRYEGRGHTILMSRELMWF